MPVAQATVIATADSAVAGVTAVLVTDHFVQADGFGSVRGETAEALAEWLRAEEHPVILKVRIESLFQLSNGVKNDRETVLVDEGDKGCPSQAVCWI